MTDTHCVYAMTVECGCPKAVTQGTILRLQLGLIMIFHEVFYPVARCYCIHLICQCSSSLRPILQFCCPQKMAINHLLYIEFPQVAPHLSSVTSWMFNIQVMWQMFFYPRKVSNYVRCLLIY